MRPLHADSPTRTSTNLHGVYTVRQVTTHHWKTSTKVHYILTWNKSLYVATYWNAHSGNLVPPPHRFVMRTVTTVVDDTFNPLISPRPLLYVHVSRSSVALCCAYILLLRNLCYSPLIDTVTLMHLLTSGFSELYFHMNSSSRYMTTCTSHPPPSLKHHHPIAIGMWSSGCYILRHLAKITNHSTDMPILHSWGLGSNLKVRNCKYFPHTHLLSRQLLSPSWCISQANTQQFWIYQH